MNKDLIPKLEYNVSLDGNTTTYKTVLDKCLVVISDSGKLNMVVSQEDQNIEFEYNGMGIAAIRKYLNKNGINQISVDLEKATKLLNEKPTI